MEIMIFALTSFLIGILITFIFEMILKGNRKLRKKYYKHHEILFGYHVHHSTYGLICLVCSLISFALGRNLSAISLVFIGLGIIAMHTFSDGRFVFIERERP